MGYLEEQSHPLQAATDGPPSHLFCNPPFDRLFRAIQFLQIDLIRVTVQEGEVIIYDDQLVFEFLCDCGERCLVNINPLQR